MRLNLINILIIICLILYQSDAHSKISDKSNFNHKYLSNYFSALVSYGNNNNKKALKYFNLSKSIELNNKNYLKKYMFTLVSNEQIPKTIKEISNWKKNKNINDFEMNVLLLIDSLTKKEKEKGKIILSDLLDSKNENTYEPVIYEILKSYYELFLFNEINVKSDNQFGRLSAITNAFQNCYLGTDKTDQLFLNLINSPDGNYSRYLFFYFSKKVEEKDYETVRQISSTIDPIDNGLLILQSKDWIDKSNMKKFNKVFSCKNPKHLLSEFFFLMANLYASDDDYILSNFYLKISHYLNPNFYYNLTLLAENYYIYENYEETKKVLNKFDNKDDVYTWYQTKKKSKIIAKQKNDVEALNFIQSKFIKIQEASLQINFDMANIYKGFKKYEEAIKLYSFVINKIDKNSEVLADILYRRGGSYERIGNYKKSDVDLLNSLKLVPNDPYVKNYLAYSWLERNYKINEALDMLKEAYDQKKNDPYIIDSIGWAYYLIKDYEEAEQYMLKAIQLMPSDPIVNDHYGDIMWMLNKKIQARYFWNNALIQDDIEEEAKKKIEEKLLKGMNES